MTRENKLALVVGFGLILVVGILVSDHFSVANQQQVAALGGVIDDPLGDVGRNIPRLVEYGDAEQIRQRHAAQLAMHATQIPADTRGGVMNHQFHQGTPLLHDPSTGANTAAHYPSLGANQPPIITATDQPLAQRPADAALVRATDPGLPGFEPVSGSEVPFTFREVRERESLSSLCREYYGDAALVKQLAAFNGITDPNQVKAGTRLRMPVRASLVVGGGASASSDAADTKPKSPPATAAPPKTYTVAGGDTLSQISLKVMGTSKKWKTLYEFNKDVVKDPDNLLVGTVLKVPTS